MALYVAADKPLSVIPWRVDAPAFHVTELKSEQEIVRKQFTHPHVYYVGTHEGCACPFNYGREFPEHEDDPSDLAAARDCVARLSVLVRTSKNRFSALSYGRTRAQRSVRSPQSRLAKRFEGKKMGTES